MEEEQAKNVVDTITQNWEKIKGTFDKMDQLVKDLKNCQTVFVQNLLISAINKYEAQLNIKIS